MTTRKKYDARTVFDKATQLLQNSLYNPASYIFMMDSGKTAEASGEIKFEIDSLRALIEYTGMQYQYGRYTKEAHQDEIARVRALKENTSEAIIEKIENYGVLENQTAIDFKAEVIALCFKLHNLQLSRDAALRLISVLKENYGDKPCEELCLYLAWFKQDAVMDVIDDDDDEDKSLITKMISYQHEFYGFEPMLDYARLGVIAAQESLCHDFFSFYYFDQDNWKKFTSMQADNVEVQEYCTLIKDITANCFDKDSTNSFDRLWQIFVTHFTEECDKNEFIKALESFCAESEQKALAEFYIARLYYSMGNTQKGVQFLRQSLMDGSLLAVRMVADSYSTGKNGFEQNVKKATDYNGLLDGLRGLFSGFSAENALLSLLSSGAGIDPHTLVLLRQIHSMIHPLSFENKEYESSTIELFALNGKSKEALIKSGMQIGGCGVTAAKAKAQIILDVLSSILPTRMACHSRQDACQAVRRDLIRGSLISKR